MFLHGQPTVFRLFELYIFLYFTIHEGDMDFHLHIFACVYQQIEICDSQDAESAKCQKLAQVIPGLFPLELLKQIHFPTKFLLSRLKGCSGLS